MSSFKFIPVANFDHSDITHSYQTLLQSRSSACFTMLFGMFVSDFVTSALMSWSKFKFTGRFVIFRVAILHCIAEFVILSGGFIVGPLNGYSIYETLSFARDSFLARTIVMIILLPFVRFIIWYIQNKVEGVVVFDYRKEFNPFRFGVRLSDAVQFDAKEWAQIPKHLKKTFNFEKAVKFYNATRAVINIRIM